MKQVPPELLATIGQRLGDGLKPEKVILFGSPAYGTPTESSDIDLLVGVPEAPEPRYRRARKAYACLWGITAPVEIIVATPQEGERTSFLLRAMREGRVLYG